MGGGGSTRFETHLNILKKHVGHVESMLEIGSNQGRFGCLCADAELADHIVLTDYDYGAVNKMYLHLKDFKSKAKIVSGILDVVNIELEACKKFQSELVVANALSHHLLLRQHMEIGKLFAKLDFMSQKFLLIEFMPLGLWTPEKSEKVPKWYNLAWFLGAMKQYYDILVCEQIETNRIICLGKKRNE